MTMYLTFPFLIIISYLILVPSSQFFSRHQQRHTKELIWSCSLNIIKIFSGVILLVFHSKEFPLLRELVKFEIFWPFYGIGQDCLVGYINTGFGRMTFHIWNCRCHAISVVIMAWNGQHHVFAIEAYLKKWWLSLQCRNYSVSISE